MTDKQIIIDGVDVSNFCLVCYYDNKTNELVRIEQYNDNDSSMYSDIESYEYGYNAKIVKPEEIIKQLKRKEQECEELKKQLKEMNEVIRTETTRCNLVNILKTELDQLKAENKELKKVSCKFKDYCTCDTEKLKQTLTEIKEIAKMQCVCGVNCQDMKIILQKISECEVER